MSDTLGRTGGQLRGPSRIAWAIPLIPVALSGFFLSAMTWFRLQGGRPTGAERGIQGLIVGLYESFGFEPLFMVCVLVLTWSSIWFLTGRVERPLGRLARIGALGLCLAILVNLRADGVTPDGAGELGAYLAERMVGVFAPTLSILLVACASVAALLLATDFFFYSYFEGIASRRLARPPAGDLPVEPDAVASFEELDLGRPAAAPRTVARATAPLAPEPEPEPARGVGPHRAEPVAVSVRAPSVDPRAVQDEDEDEEGGEAARERESAEDDGDDADADAVDGLDEAWTATAEEPLEDGAGEADDEADIDREIDEQGDDAAWAAATDKADAAVDADEPAAIDSTAAHADEEEQVGDVWDADGADETLEDAGPKVEAGPSDEPDEPDEPEAAWMAESDESPEDAVPESNDDVEDDWTATAEDQVAEDEESEPEDTPPETAEPTVTLERIRGGEREASPAESEPIREIERPADSASGARARQGALFGSSRSDPGLVDEAASMVLEYRRASANFLKRRLRVSTEEAMEILQELARRGVIECEEGAAHGRISAGQ